MPQLKRLISYSSDRLFKKCTLLCTMYNKGVGYMYILECSDGSYYTGSTIDLVRRINQHNQGVGANHTANRLPVELVYVEVYMDIYKAFYRERQIHGWSRAKKEALIKNKRQLLPRLARRKKNVK